ncbi:MAG: hypothetical protein ACJAXB_002374 [Candidatus Endobugula sp.]|jgi:hypothetical protein
MRKLITLLFFLTATTSLFSQVYFEEKVAQETDSVKTSDFKERVYIGGNFSVNLGTDFSFVDISPLVGYMLTPQFSVGVGASYLYLSRRYILFPSGNSFKVNTSVYGGRTFLRRNILENYFAHLEFEALNVEFASNNTTENTIREWVPGLFIGAGIFQPVFGRGGVNVTLLYNLLHDEIKSPYNSAFVVRAGFTL